MFFDQSFVKTIMSGGYGSMGSEYCSSGDFAQRLVEFQTVLLHGLTDHFEWSKSTMTFIQVMHTRSNSQGL